MKDIINFLARKITILCITGIVITELISIGTWYSALLFILYAFYKNA